MYVIHAPAYTPYSHSHRTSSHCYQDSWEGKEFLSLENTSSIILWPISRSRIEFGDEVILQQKCAADILKITACTSHSVICEPSVLKSGLCCGHGCVVSGEPKSVKRWQSGCHCVEKWVANDCQEATNAGASYVVNVACWSFLFTLL